MTAAASVRDATTSAYALRLGDTALVLGQQLAAWTGRGPALEEDLALANVALDLVGHARLWLAYAGEREGAGRDEDALAYFRAPHEFCSVLLVERPNGDYADTMVRQFFFDAWHVHLLRALERSSDARIAAIAAKAAREATYHLRRSGDWVVRLGDGTATSHDRTVAAVDRLWPYTGELFTPDAVDREALARGIGCDLEALHAPWLAHVRDVFAAATLAVPAGGYMQTGGKAGRHGERFGYLIAEMQAVRRSVPGDRW